MQQHYFSLTEDQRKDPYLVFEEVFEYARYPEMKDALWIWYKTTVNGSYKRLSWRQKDAMTTSYVYTD